VLRPKGASSVSLGLVGVVIVALLATTARPSFSVHHGVLVAL
jgi:hypothetical protein